ncbi:MAG TPA: hypothetical protein PKA14_25385 [Leptospiraceae bacterium]|nr:hypothetical protein [Leptospiraceae bacterium]
MAVPRKRVKLDLEEAAKEAEKAAQSVENAENQEEKGAKKASTRTYKPRKKKVEDAFDVVDKLGNTGAKLPDIQRIPPPKDQGFHIQFKLDLISVEDILNPEKNADNKKDSSIVFDFTIPYIWNLPVFNEITKTVVNELKRLKVLQ